jgi:PadR family transcriptional regulator, regulatory protein PadR
MRVESDLMRGAGPVAVLQLLSRGEMYGYELVQALDKQSKGILAMGDSTLYPMLYNLEAKGLIASRVDETGARARRYYRLTEKGSGKLAQSKARWESLVEAMGALGVVEAKLMGGA